jgi:hypothetical protein
MVRRPLIRAVVAALALTLVSAACGTDNPRGTAAQDIKQLPPDFLKDTYLGLTPQREDIGGSLHNQEANAYISAVGLFSFRHNDLLQATLQISKLSDKARPKSSAFQQQIASQVGGTKAQPFVMGGRRVFRSSQRKQTLTSWFRGDYFMILSVRDSYDYPRALLRTLLTEVDPT